MKRLILALAILILTNVPTFAQTASLDWDDQAQDVDSMSEAAWEDRVNNDGSDYLLYRYSTIRENDLDVNVARQLRDESNCEGYTTPDAFYAVHWHRDDINERERLRFFAVSRADTALVIRQPDGKWICNDNYSGTQHPLIDIERPRTGTYYIWVTNKERTEFGADLYITLENHNPRPNQYPTTPYTYMVPSNPASGATAQIVYIEVEQTTTRCNISVDVRVANMDGYTQIRLVVYPITSNQRIRSSSNTSSSYRMGNYIGVAREAGERPGFGVTNYDYGQDSNEPFELQIPHSVMPNNISSYQMEVVLQQEINNQWQDMVTYSTTSSQRCRP